MTNFELVQAFFAGAPDDLVAAIEDPEWVEAARQGLAPLLAPDFEFVTVRHSVGFPGARKGVEGFFTASSTDAHSREIIIADYDEEPEMLESDIRQG